MWRAGIVAWPNHDAGDECADTGGDVDDDAPGQIDDAHLEKPAAGAPDHVANGEIHEQGPKSGEGQHRGEFDALHKRAHHEGGRDDEERHLKHHKEDARDIAVVVGSDAAEKCLLEISDEGIGFTEGECVAADHPQDTHDAGDDEAVHQDRKDILSAYEAAVEKGETGEGHEEHEGAAGEDPRGVAGVDRHGVALGGCRGAEEEGEYAGDQETDRCALHRVHGLVF